VRQDLKPDRDRVIIARPWAAPHKIKLSRDILYAIVGVPAYAFIVAGHPRVRVEGGITEDTSAEEATTDHAMAAAGKLDLDLGYDSKGDLQLLLVRIGDRGSRGDRDVPGKTQWAIRPFEVSPEEPSPLNL